MMARYQVILAYDGTDFFGFQRQVGEEVRTVQSVIESTLRCLGWQDRTVHAAGRTDTGVHATGQVVVFDLDWKHTEDQLRSALNANLPTDVAAVAVGEVHPGFHPRYDALSRRYHYQILVEPVRNPLMERYAWRVWPELDLGRMQQAADDLLGTHDFSAFGTPPRTGGTTVRTIDTAEWRINGTGVVFIIQANAFLYHMVRRLVSFQAAIGQGLEEPEAIRRHIESPPKEMVQGLAPPQGLTLVEVMYPDDSLVKK